MILNHTIVFTIQSRTKGVLQCWGSSSDIGAVYVSHVPTSSGTWNAQETLECLERFDKLISQWNFLVTILCYICSFVGWIILWYMLFLTGGFLVQVESKSFYPLWVIPMLHISHNLSEFAHDSVASWDCFIPWFSGQTLSGLRRGH
jgi:hypothetical protein